PAVPAGWVTTPLLAVAGFLVGAGQPLFENAAQAMVVAVAGRDPRRLSQANGQLVATLTVGQPLAPPPLASAAAGARPTARGPPPPPPAGSPPAHPSAAPPSPWPPGSRSWPTRSPSVPA